MRYFSDVAALARKDLLIELRAKETVPAMLLFVLSALDDLPLRGAGRAPSAAQVSLGLLWTAIVFTALLGLTRAFVPEREQGVFDALVLAPSDRSAIWLAKAFSVLRVPRRSPSSSRCPAFGALLPRRRLAHGRRGRARGHRHLRRRHAHRRDGGRRAGRAS